MTCTMFLMKSFRSCFLDLLTCCHVMKKNGLYEHKMKYRCKIILLVDGHNFHHRSTKKKQEIEINRRKMGQDKNTKHFQSKHADPKLLRY